MKIVKAPERINLVLEKQPFIFLAGSIDMGAAVDWQKEVQDALEGFEGTIFNPRRDDWDDTWEQDISNPQFYEQVTWVLNSLDHSDLILVYFDPKGKAPITLLELGLFKDRKIAVCCPEGYWRRGNVQIVCERYDIPLMESLDELIGYAKLFVRDSQ